MNKIIKIEGWAFPLKCRSAHYFIDGTSLCKRWGFLGSCEGAKGADITGPDDCLKCRAELNKRKIAKTAK